MTLDGLDEPFGGEKLGLIAGPCVLESLEIALEVAERVKQLAERLGLPYVFKSSFDKANRTSLGSFRGPGLEQGLQWLAQVREQVGVPVLTDVHEPAQVPAVAEVVDVVQIPAFLCRQTDLLVAAARSGRVVNIKRGQFLAPQDMAYAAAKVAESGNERILLTERGTTFGYRDLVVDFRGLKIMRATGWPVVFDATHSVQQPGGAGGASGGRREFVPLLARAAVAAGVDALFFEVHPSPDEALCDGPNMLSLDALAVVLEQVVGLREALRAAPSVEED
ncbi:MAG: 3-deoxy-8-phosphooctulonate synthase [Armatimonadetes bacterium]|nr:3-deoxy-8-phosphooctulonate synthase [Armatimonadota bacterium]